MQEWLHLLLLACPQEGRSSQELFFSPRSDMNPIPSPFWHPPPFLSVLSSTSPSLFVPLGTGRPAHCCHYHPSPSCPTPRSSYAENQAQLGTEAGARGGFQCPCAHSWADRNTPGNRAGRGNPPIAATAIVPSSPESPAEAGQEAPELLPSLGPTGTAAVTGWGRMGEEGTC